MFPLALLEMAESDDEFDVEIANTMAKINTEEHVAEVTPRAGPSDLLSLLLKMHISLTHVLRTTVAAHLVPEHHCLRSQKLQCTSPLPFC